MSKKIKIAIVLGLVFALAVVVAIVPGCKGTTATTTAAETTAAVTTAAETTSAETTAAETTAAAVKKLVAINVFDTSLLWQNCVDRYTALATEHGWDTISAIFNNDSQKAITNVDSFITQKADYIYFQLSDKGLEQTVQEKCDAAKIPVIFNGMEEPGFITITADNYNAGITAGKKLGEAVMAKWDGKPDMVLVAGIPSLGDLNAKRMQGMLEGFQSVVTVDKSKIVQADINEIDALKSTDLMTNVLTAHPDAKRIALLGFMDQFEVIPMINAAKAAGRLDQILATSFHISDPAAPGLLKQYPDIWIGQIDFSGNSYADKAFELIDMMEKGQAVEKKLYYTVPVWVDATNVDQLYPASK
jgi:ABC-type sugar transport system, periplasmic component